VTVILSGWKVAVEVVFEWCLEGLGHAAGGDVGAVEKLVGRHAAFAGGLHVEESEEAVLGGHVEVASAIGADRSGRECVWLGDALAAEHFGRHPPSVGREDLGPGRGIGGQTANEVVDAFGGLTPFDVARVAEDLRSVAQRGGVGRERLLLRRLHMSIMVDDSVYGLDNQCGTNSHQSVVHRARVVRFRNGQSTLQNDVARVDLMAEKEGGDARFLGAMDDGPVDRRRAESAMPFILRATSGSMLPPRSCPTG